MINLCVLWVVRKNRRPPFDQAQDERLSTRILVFATPFMLRLSKHKFFLTTWASAVNPGFPTFGCGFAG
jgi:hypothetical protein